MVEKEKRKRTFDFAFPVLTYGVHKIYKLLFNSLNNTDSTESNFVDEHMVIIISIGSLIRLILLGFMVRLIFNQ